MQELRSEIASVAVSSSVGELLTTLQQMDAASQSGPPEYIPVHLVPASGVGLLYDVSGKQVANWLTSINVNPTDLEFGENKPRPYYPWEVIKDLSPLAIARSSPVSRVLLEHLPTYRQDIVPNDDRAYARLLQLILSRKEDIPHVPLDWLDPISERPIEWLGIANAGLSKILAGRREIVIVQPAVYQPPVITLPVVEKPAEIPLGVVPPTEDAVLTGHVEASPADSVVDADVSEPAAPPPAAAPKAYATHQLMKDSIVQPDVRIVAREDNVESRPQQASVSVLFEMDLSREDLCRLRGVDSEIIDTVIKEVVTPRSDSKTGLTDASEIYRGAELQKILIRLFGIKPEDAEHYLGVREGIIERYLGQTYSTNREVIRDPQVWDALLRELRPNKIEYSPMPDRPAEDYGFDNTKELLEFLGSNGGGVKTVKVGRVKRIMLSYPAQELLKMQLERANLPDASDEAFNGWQSTGEMSEATFRHKDEVIDWTQQLPMRVGPLDAGRKAWLRSRQEPKRILAHYSPAVGALFKHVSAQRLDDELMQKRRRDLYYPKESVLPISN